jgi:hypothetical protein
LSLIMQATHDPCNVTLASKYGVDTPVNHTL